MNKQQISERPRLRRMDPWKDQSGKSSVRGLIALVIVVGVVYGGMKFIPVRAAALQFEDAIRDEVMLAGGRRRPTDTEIKGTLVDRAKMLDLPITSGSITITRSGRKHIRIEALYTVTIEMVGGYNYDWRFAPEAEGPLF